MGTKLVNGPMAGRLLLGVSACTKGETYIVGAVKYRATGRRTTCDHWEAVYVPDRKRKGK